jgi:hypothetical protein
MSVRSLTTVLGLCLFVACQAPVPATPTPTPVAVVRTPPPVPTPQPPATGASRVETLNAANAAFTNGDLTTAGGLYERVINTPPTGEDPNAAAAITAFARFRDMVALLGRGREDDANAQLQALQRADANSPFARLASQLWDQYGMVGGLPGACAQIQPQVVSQAGPTLSTLQGLGVSVDPRSLCSVPTKP